MHAKILPETFKFHNALADPSIVWLTSSGSLRELMRPWLQLIEGSSGNLVIVNMSRVQTTTELSPHPLWLQGDWRTANPLGLEADGYFDAVGDPNKRDATIHPVLSTVEGHGSINHAGSRALAGDCEE